MIKNNSLSHNREIIINIKNPDVNIAVSKVDNVKLMMNNLSGLYDNNGFPINNPSNLGGKKWQE